MLIKPFGWTRVTLLWLGHVKKKKHAIIANQHVDDTVESLEFVMVQFSNFHGIRGYPSSTNIHPQRNNK